MSRLGVGIGSVGVRAILLRRGVIVWRDEEARTGGESPGQTLSRLFARLPRGLIRPRVVAAIGPEWVQMKRLNGLPAGAQTPVLTEAVRANVERFFLRNGVSLRVADLEASHGQRWGAAFEEPLVAEVTQACRGARLRLDGCIPSIRVVCGTEDGNYRWRDGETLIQLRVAAGAIASIRRNRTAGCASDSGSTSASAHGIDVAPYADALGAARVARGCPMLLRVDDARRRWRRRLRACLAVGVVATAGADLVAPVAAAVRAQRIAERQLAALRPTSVAVAGVGHELRSVTLTLQHIARFAESRRPMLPLLGDLARVIPESTVVLSFRADSIGGTVVAASESGAAILALLARGEQLENPRILGALTPEGSGARQRLTIQFQRPRRGRRR